jgi:mannosyltransferase OCH1-like enzyme
MSIPKKIHYCWFGGSEKPELVQRCIETFERFMPDYEIIEWNESNFDYAVSEFALKNYERGKYGFVSDYFRLKTLYDHGGIYIDSDVEIKKSFTPLLAHEMFMGFMINCNLGTAVIGCEKHSRVIKELLDEYENLEVSETPSNDIFTRFFLRKFPSFLLNNQFQLLDGQVAIYPKEYFERPAWKKDRGYAVHHYLGSWYDKKSSLSKGLAKKVLGPLVYSWLAHYRALKKSPFYPLYKEHKRRRH